MSKPLLHALNVGTLREPLNWPLPSELSIPSVTKVELPDSVQYFV